MMMMKMMTTISSYKCYQQCIMATWMSGEAALSCMCAVLQERTAAGTRCDQTVTWLQRCAEA